MSENITFIHSFGINYDQDGDWYIQYTVQNARKIVLS